MPTTTILLAEGTNAEGAEALQRTFANFVDQMRVGSGIDDVRWAQNYLQKWSGWT